MNTINDIHHNKRYILINHSIILLFLLPFFICLFFPFLLGIRMEDTIFDIRTPERMIVEMVSKGLITEYQASHYYRTMTKNDAIPYSYNGANHLYHPDSKSVRFSRESSLIFSRAFNVTINIAGISPNPIIGDDEFIKKFTSTIEFDPDGSPVITLTQTLPVAPAGRNNLAVAAAGGGGGGGGGGGNVVTETKCAVGECRYPEQMKKNFCKWMAVSNLGNALLIFFYREESVLVMLWNPNYKNDGYFLIPLISYCWVNKLDFNDETVSDIDYVNEASRRHLNQFAIRFRQDTFPTILNMNGNINEEKNQLFRNNPSKLLNTTDMIAHFAKADKVCIAKEEMKEIEGKIKRRMDVEDDDE